MTISVPEYFIGYLLIKYVAVRLGWFPSLATVFSDSGFPSGSSTRSCRC